MGCISIQVYKIWIYESSPRWQNLFFPLHILIFIVLEGGQDDNIFRAK